MTITSSTTARLVAVCGSTGAQGRSVINALQASQSPYRIRGFTRDPSRPAGQELSKLGVEVVQLDLAADNQAGMTQAFKGADVVFGMTNFWESLDKKKEFADGKSIIQSAIDAKVSLLIFSGLSSLAKLTNGRFAHVDHFEGKADIAAFGHSQKSDSFNFVVVQPASYNQNIPGSVQPTGETIDGKPAYRYSLPTEKRIASMDVGDYGLWVQAVIEHPELQQGEDVLACTAEITGFEMAEEITKNSNIHLTYVPLKPEEFKERLSPAVAEELTQMYQAIDDVGYFGGADWQKFYKYLSSRPKTFGEWVQSVNWQGGRRGGSH